MTPYSKARDHYLIQRVLGASPEQLAALLLEGAQRFLTQASQAIARKDYAAKGRAVNRVTSIIEELVMNLDLENGGELAQNLLRLYDWWSRDTLEASLRLDAARMERISGQMGDLRQSWEQSAQQRIGVARTESFQAGDLVG